MPFESSKTDAFKEITVVLADDHKVVRQGLRAILEAERGLRVIGEAGSGLEAIRLVERLLPNVLVLDLMIPELNGLEVTRQLKKRLPKIRVVILSMHSHESYVVEALKNLLPTETMREIYREQWDEPEVKVA